MNKGMFDLSILENVADDSTADLNLNEGGEFAPNSNAKTGMDNGVSDAKVSIPGGDKETPTAKPEGGEQSVPVPGGLSEKPTAKPADEASIPVPSKIEMDASTYNEALAKLQQSFKEGVDVLDMLKRVDVVQKTQQERQQEFTENAMSEAMLAAYEDGPIFEAVSRSDKHDVKKIVHKVRNKIYSWLGENDVKYYKAHKILTILFDGARSTQLIWSTRLWQFIGVVHIEAGNIQDLCKNLTEEFAEDLGDYKILAVATPKNIVDIFMTKFGWKNHKGAYMLLVDKKLDAELKNSVKEMALAANKDGGDTKGDSKKDDSKKDSEE